MSAPPCADCGKPVTLGNVTAGVLRCVDCAQSRTVPKPESHSQKVTAILRSARQKVDAAQASRGCAAGHVYEIKRCGRCGHEEAL